MQLDHARLDLMSFVNSHHACFDLSRETYAKHSVRASVKSVHNNSYG